MGRRAARRLGRELVRARRKSGHNRLSVEHFSRQESEKLGKDFFVHNSTLFKYERGSWPSPPKLLTLARAYGVPVGDFFRALGATDSEICGHRPTAEDREIIQLLKDPAFTDLHRQLHELLRSGADVASAVALIIEMAVRGLEAARLTGESKKGPSEVIYRGHDEPREPVYVDLPYFADRVPAGVPTEVEPDGYRKVPVLRHLYKEGRYVVRVRGDSMSPEIRDKDLLLVDYYREAQSGDIICVLLNGESLVKQLVRRGRGVRLHSFNDSYEDIRITRKDDFKIQGVVIRVVERDLTRRG